MSITFKKKALGVLLASSLLPAVAVADSFRIQDIRVNGLHGIDSKMIYSVLPFRVGQVYQDAFSTQVIQQLYRTGVFDDVKVYGSRGIVYIQVKERPTISSVTFKGLKTIPKDPIQEALKGMGLAVGQPLNTAILEKAKTQIRQQYLIKGNYGVDVDVVITPLPNYRSGVSFVIKEGVNARIRHIEFVGNQHISAYTLKREMQQTEPGIWTWYTGTNKYQRSKLDQDVQKLTRYYFDQGYLDATIDVPVIRISQDRRDIDVQMQIHEGEKYRISKVSFMGHFLGQDESFFKLVQTKEGAVPSISLIEEDVQRISERLGELGYALANVSHQFKKDPETHTTEVIFIVDPAQRTYVRRIEIGGNSQTRDEVIRREIHQDEGAWYSARDIQLAKYRIGRLGYFKSVDIQRVPVEGSPDQVDLKVQVEEDKTGLINFTAGYGSANGLSAGIAIKKSNIFGSGTDLSFKYDTSKYNRQLEFSHTDPYWTDAGISRTASLYYQRVFDSPKEGQPLEEQYYRRNMGVGLYFTVPVAEDHRVSLSAHFDRNEIHNAKPAENTYLWRYLNDKEKGYGPTVNTVALSLGWSYDTRNSIKVPTKGFLIQLLPQVTVGDINTFGIYAKAQYHYTIFDAVTLSLNGEANYNQVFNPKKDYPLIKHLTAGGIGSVRGFANASMGPVDIDGTPVGGSQRYFANAELYFPVPGMGKDKSLRWFVFSDVGSVKASKKEYCKFSEQFEDPCGWRYSAGVGLSWDSPLGTLIQVSYGVPLNLKKGDHEERFQFQLNASF